ncbi:VOC family protein [Nocardia sp. NPDC055321]
MNTYTAGSVLVGSAHAQELRDWYCRVLAPEQIGDGPFVFGGTLLIIEDRDDVADTNLEPGRVIVNFHVEDFDTAAAQLTAAGVDWVAAAHDRPVGRFGTFTDPDGNLLQIIQFAPDAHTTPAS